MYNPQATSHWDGSCTPSRPKPTPQAINDNPIRILGRHVPKSTQVSISLMPIDDAFRYIPAKLPKTKKIATCIAKLIPFDNNTMLFTVRLLHISYQHIPFPSSLPYLNPKSRLYSPPSKPQNPCLPTRLIQQILECSRGKVKAPSPLRPI